MEDRENWIKAGHIAGQALAYGRGLIKPGAMLLDTVDKIEEKIKSLGGKPAFPVQISLNHLAAHFCPEADDTIVFSDQLAKLDVGVEVDGCIGDNACTVDLSGKHLNLVKASAEALEGALGMVKPGVRVNDIGRRIHEIITDKGYSPIRNLSGHGLDKFNIHAKPTVPNFDNGDSTELKKGQVIAIEPFASTGSGIVTEGTNATVFVLANAKPVRDMTTRQILAEISTYRDLPFAKRWLQRKFSPMRVNLALRQLSALGIIRDYPPLSEQAHGLVSQAEATVLVDDEPIVLTMI